MEQRLLVLEPAGRLQLVPRFNHPDVLNVFNNMYSRNSAALKAFTNTRFSIDGIWVPETMGWDGNANGNSQYTNDIFSPPQDRTEHVRAVRPHGRGTRT